MPRGGKSIPELPFRTWVLTVDPDNRVRIPIEIRTLVPWISPEDSQIDCVGRPGPSGGIQVLPLANHLREVQAFAEAVGDKPPTESESPGKWIEVARLLATFWPIVFNIEATRISITLPEPSRRAQQVPQSGGAVVVFGFGSILEIWDALKWHDHVRGMAKRKAAAIAEALEELEQR
jgi:hypothetical protein